MVRGAVVGRPHEGGVQETRLGALERVRRGGGSAMQGEEEDDEDFDSDDEG